MCFRIPEEQWDSHSNNGIPRVYDPCVLFCRVISAR